MYPLILNLVTSWQSVFSYTLRPLYLPCPLNGDWMGLRAVLGVLENTKSLPPVVVHWFYLFNIDKVGRAGRSGIESRWGRDFPPVQTGPRAHPATCKMGTGSFPGVKCSWSVLLNTYPLLVPRSWKSRAIPLPTPWATLCL